MPVAPACDQPCSECPWRTANQGKSHPGHWYTKVNLRFLWAKLRRGENMSCHPTDPNNPLPPGFEPVKEGVTTRECAGALLLVQREVMVAQKIGKYAAYRKARPSGLTKEGLQATIYRGLFTMPGEVAMNKNLDLREPAVDYAPLKGWHEILFGPEGA